MTRPAWPAPDFRKCGERRRELDGRQEASAARGRARRMGRERRWGRAAWARTEKRRGDEETRCPPRPRGVWRLRGKQSPGGDKPEPKDDTASRLQTPRALRVPGRPASEGRREAGPGAGALLPLGSTAGLSPRTQEAACFTGLSVFTPEPKQPNTMQAQLTGMSLTPAARNRGDGVTGQRRAAAKPRRGTPASREPMPCGLLVTTQLRRARRSGQTLFPTKDRRKKARPSFFGLCWVSRLSPRDGDGYRAFSADQGLLRSSDTH